MKGSKTVAVTDIKKAQQARLARTSTLKALRAANPDIGRQHCADLILNPPDCLNTMLIIDLLQNIRFFGKSNGGAAVLAERMLQAAGVGWSLQVGKLTSRQRSALAGGLQRMK